MLCQRCGLREAEIFQTQRVGDKLYDRDLCSVCAKLDYGVFLGALLQSQAPALPLDGTGRTGAQAGAGRSRTFRGRAGPRRLNGPAQLDWRLATGDSLQIVVAFLVQRVGHLPSGNQHRVSDGLDRIPHRRRQLPGLDLVLKPLDSAARSTGVVSAFCSPPVTRARPTEAFA